MSKLRLLESRRFAWIGFVVALLLNGCVGPQMKASTQALTFNLNLHTLQADKLAFITPSSVTGQEEDKQAMAMAFAQAMQQARPTLKVVSLAEAVSAINAAGLAGDYKQMLNDYHITGLFEHKVLQKIAQTIGVRYIAQLQLRGFRQDNKNRWSLLGFRLIDTKTTNIRIFLQIWDSQNGSVVWEGSQELTAAKDSLSEETITFRQVMDDAAQQLISKLP